MQISSTRPRFSACWMMLALAMVTNLSPAISFAVVIASSTLPVKVVRGNRSGASAGGGRWVTTTTGAPAGHVLAEFDGDAQQQAWDEEQRRGAQVAVDIGLTAQGDRSDDGDEAGDRQPHLGREVAGQPWQGQERTEHRYPSRVLAEGE